MTRRIRPTLAASVAAGLLLLALPAAGQSPRSDEDSSKAPEDVTWERRVVVDVDGDSGPRVWQFDTRGGYLGVGLVELTPDLRRHFGASESAGVMIGSIEEDSPASRAGLRIADVITAIDGEPATSREAVGRAIADAEEGETVAVEVTRNGRKVTVEAQVEQRERPQLLLSHSGDHYAFRWRTDGGPPVLATPLPDGPPTAARPRPVEPVIIQEVMGRLHERLDSPEFQAKMLEIRSKNQELEARVRELEARLRELSHKLDALEN